MGAILKAGSCRGRESVSLDSLTNYSEEAATIPYPEVQAVALSSPGLCKHQTINQRAAWSQRHFQSKSQSLGSVPVSSLSTLTLNL